MSLQPFRIDERVEQQAQRLCAAGEVDLAVEDELVTAAAAALERCPDRPLVLDLTAVTFMDSSGLRGVLRCQRAARERGVPFRVAVTDGPVSRLFQLAGVASWLDYE